MTRVLASFLALFLSIPNPAFALRVQNGGLEERTPTVKKLENTLRGGLGEYHPEQVEYETVSLFAGGNSPERLDYFALPLLDKNHRENWRNKIPEVALFSGPRLESFPFVVWNNFGISHTNLGIEYQGRKIPFVQAKIGMNEIWSVSTFMPSEWISWFVENLEKSQLDPALAQFLRKNLAIEKNLPTVPLEQSAHTKWLLDVLDRITRATVKIQQVDPHGTVFDAGSGTIVKFDQNTYVLTAAHVVADESYQYRIEATTGQTFPLRILEENPQRDQTVLGPVPELESIAFPIQEERVEKLLAVISVGYPGDSQGRMRKEPHVMFAVGDMHQGKIVYEAPRAEGMSGGALLNLNTGKLIGVISHGASRDATGFPVDKKEPLPTTNP